MLKALAELRDMSLCDLIEGIALHALEGKLPFTPETIAQAAKLREVYGLPLIAEDPHRLTDLGKEQQ